MKLNILVLFSGSGGWEYAWNKTQSFDISIDSLDIIKKPHINYCMDIRNFKPNKEYHFIYASPPCNIGFSQLCKTNKFNKNNINLSLELAKIAFNICKTAKYAYVIENPYTGSMKKYFPDYKIVDYSEYNYPMRKRTAIWSNLPLNLKLQPKNKYNQYPISYLSSIQRMRIPEKLSDYVKRIMIKTYNKELQQFKLPYRK